MEYVCYNEATLANRLKGEDVDSCLFLVIILVGTVILSSSKWVRNDKLHTIKITWFGLTHCQDFKNTDFFQHLFNI